MFQVDRKNPSSTNGVEMGAEVGATSAEVNVKAANEGGVFSNSLLFNNPFSTQNSTTLKEYIDKLKEVDADKKFIFIPIDKEIYSGLKYSAIAICSQAKKDNKDVIYYYTVLLTSTGRAALSAAEFVDNEIKSRQANIPNGENYTYTDAMNTNLDMQIRSAIKNKLGEIKCINCDGVVYKANISEGTQRLLYLANNAIELAKLENKIGLNLPKISESIQGKARFYFNVTSLPKDKYDDMGNIQMATFKAELGVEAINENAANRELNSRTFDTVLVEITGFITPQPVTTDTVVNGVVTKTYTMAPNIVVTDVYTRIPDSSSNVLAIAVAGMMTHKNNWLKVLVDSAERLKLGSLNYMLKLYPDDQIQYKEFSFSDLTPEEKSVVISNLFQGTPNVSFDVTPNQYNNNLNFLSYAENTASSEREAKYIAGSDLDFEKGIELLLGKHTKYNNKKILTKITIPYGYVTDKKGECMDIRNITLGTVLSATKGQDETVYRSFMGMLTPNNPNAFNNYIEVIKFFYETAVIEGKTTRVTFDNTFLNYLISQVIGCTQGIINKNNFVSPQTITYDYGIFNQQQVNVNGLNQNIFNNQYAYNYNMYNTNAYGGIKYNY